jgi:hypothetical protein
MELADVPMIEPLENYELLNEAPAIVGRQTPWALAHAGPTTEFSAGKVRSRRRCFGRRVAQWRLLVLEIRTYRLKAGSGEAFHRVVAEQSVPLLRRFGIDVVRFGPSEQSEDGFVDYVLVRAFESHRAREEQEAQFYGSSEWRSGPREEIVSRIESDHTVVLTLATDAVDALRTAV